MSLQQNLVRHIEIKMNPVQLLSVLRGHAKSITSIIEHSGVGLQYDTYLREDLIDHAKELIRMVEGMRLVGLAESTVDESRTP